ncbi:MAG: PD-(D/E)XK nuclease family protein [Longimicrobiaceae bacterium]
MATAATSAPDPIWSPTREAILQACPRRYFYHYYLSSGGWSPGASEAARHAYRLRQLTTLDLVLGTAIHRCANLLARAIVARRARPDLVELRNRSRAALNQAWKESRDRAAFLRDPGRRAMLLPVYYRRGISQAAVERIRTKLDSCLPNLLECSLWTLVERPSTSIHVGEAPVRLDVRGVPIWAAPDLIVRPATGQPVLIEWKTGRIDRGQAEKQVMAYGLFLRDGLHVPPEKGGYNGAIVDLLRGEVETIPIREPELSAAEDRIWHGYAAMRRLLVPGTSQPKEMAEFPLATRRANCPHCNFWEICEVRHQGLGPSPRLPDPAHDRSGGAAGSSTG